jgi:RNA-binding protein Musashi
MSIVRHSYLYFKSEILLSSFFHPLAFHSQVEAKKAVPRDDQNILNRNNSSIHGSPGPARTKKIFVGGLASTVTESDFKKYFDQFGTITDVVVMYDHNTQRPRGFGFITYDSEEAID